MKVLYPNIVGHADRKGVLVGTWPGTQPAATADGGSLEADQVAAWNRDGFLVLDRFVDDDALATLRAAFDDVVSGRVRAAGDRMLGSITHQVKSPSDAHPDFNSNPALEQGLAIARQLLGTDDVRRFFDMLIDKPPGHPHDTPWHQDFAYAAQPFAAPGRRIPLETIQFWVPLDDVDAENGCMQFLPGHHAQPLLEHHVASSNAADPEARLLALVDPENQVDMSRAVVAEIPAGGLTMHAYGAPHYTGPNRSVDRPRRSYIFNVATPRFLADLAE